MSASWSLRWVAAVSVTSVVALAAPTAATPVSATTATWTQTPTPVGGGGGGGSGVGAECCDFGLCGPISRPPCRDGLVCYTPPPPSPGSIIDGWPGKCVVPPTPTLDPTPTAIATPTPDGGDGGCGGGGSDAGGHRVGEDC